MTKIPKIEKVILVFRLNKGINLNILASQLLALELITLQRSKILKSQNFQLNLKIRKGFPIGCKLILRKHLMFLFLIKLKIHYFPILKHLVYFNQYSNNIKSNIKTFSFTLDKILVFPEINSKYHLFNKLDNLNCTITANCTVFHEFYFILKSLKFPVILNKNTK